MIVDIILPYKEIYSAKKASAVSLTVKNSMEYSNFKSSIKVYGQSTDEPFSNDNFIGVKVRKFFHFGKNRSILINYINLNNLKSDTKRIIEIHNRPYIFNLAIKKISKHPITLHFHNDPITMLGSKTVAERINIAKNAAAVYFVSAFIKKKFLEGIEDNFLNLFVLPNGIQRRLKEKPKKNKEIIFLGRLVHEKGPHLFIESIKESVKKYPDWSFKIIGTSKAGQGKLITKYEKDIINNFLSLGKNTSYLGFINNDEVQAVLKNASILVIPSLWDDPFPLAALEGLSNGVAIIASNRGGLTEMLKDKGVLIDDINKNNLENSINNFLENSNMLMDYHNKSWENYNFNQSSISKIQDKLRYNIFNKFYDKF